MKKLISILLALCLFAAAALPVLAEDASYGPVIVTDGYMSITFSQAKTAAATVMLARQSWVPETAVMAQTETERKEIELIVAGSDCLVTRSGGSAAMNFAFVTLSGSDYIVGADRMELYTSSFHAHTMLSFPFVKAEMVLLTLSNGKEYFIISEKTTVKEAPPLPMSYIVQPGDTEEMIALNYYGKDGLGEALKAANPEHYAATGGILEAGRALTLPAALGGMTLRKTPLLAAGESFYTLKSGDTLSGIALKYLGDAMAYTKIITRNPDVIKSASSMLRVGTRIILPAA